MKITKKQFLQDVVAEVKAIKKTATKEEIKKLNFAELNPKNRYDCIYGQMCFGCDSNRAKELIFNCCKRYVNTITHSGSSFTNFRDEINGPTIKNVNTFNDLPRGYNKKAVFSSLENYICLKDAKNKHIIDYLQGKIKKLVL